MAVGFNADVRCMKPRSQLAALACACSAMVQSPAMRGARRVGASFPPTFRHVFGAGAGLFATLGVAGGWLGVCLCGGCFEHFLGFVGLGVIGVGLPRCGILLASLQIRTHVVKWGHLVHNGMCFRKNGLQLSHRYQIHMHSKAHLLMEIEFNKLLDHPFHNSRLVLRDHVSRPENKDLIQSVRLVGSPVTRHLPLNVPRGTLHIDPAVGLSTEIGQSQC